MADSGDFGASFNGGGSFSPSTFSNAGGAVQDLFGFFASKSRAQGNRLEAESYSKASEFAALNKQFTEQSTAIKTVQQERATYSNVGDIAATAVGTGGTLGGSALDVLREATSQGALERAVAQQQGTITAHGYEVESERYNDMADASRAAADAQEKAGLGQLIGAGLKLGAAVAPLML